jgi:hypothetical protein
MLLLQIQTPLELVPAAYRDEENGVDYAILSATSSEGTVPEAELAAASVAWLFPSFNALARFLHTELFGSDSEVTCCFMEQFWPQCCAQGSALLGQLSGDPQALQICIEVCFQNTGARCLVGCDGIACIQMNGTVQCSCCGFVSSFLIECLCSSDSGSQISKVDACACFAGCTLCRS